MRLLVDTCLWRSQADADRLGRLQRRGNAIFVPAIVMAERARQLAHDNPDMRSVDVASMIAELREQSGALELPFDGSAVRFVAEFWSGAVRGPLRYAPEDERQRHWRQHSRDLFIAATVRAASIDRIITENSDDFARWLPRELITTAVALLAPQQE